MEIEGYTRDDASTRDYVETYWPVEDDADVMTGVVISIPHCGVHGRETFGDIYPEREKEGKNHRVVKAHEQCVWHIVMDIMKRVPVNVVWGQIKRTHLDYNRPRAQAFDHEYFAKSHEVYHREIQFGLRNAFYWMYEKNENNFPPLLLDLHGFSSRIKRADQYDLILGTQHRTTIRQQEDLLLAHFLEKRGYKIYCPTSEKKKGELFTGGYTVETHKKAIAVEKQLMPVSRIQIEIHPKFRKQEGKQLGKQLSVDLAEFIAYYNSL